MKRTHLLMLAGVLCAGITWGLYGPINRALVLDPAMRRAIAEWDRPAIRQLALQGADVRMQVPAPAGTPDPPYSVLWLALNHEDLELLQVLIRRGADIKSLNTYDDTPLMRAAALGNVKMVEALLAAGAPVNARSREGETALLHAAGACTWDRETEHIETVRVLLRHGADPHITAPDFTALALAEDQGVTRLAAELRKTGSAGREACLDRIAQKGPLYAVRSSQLEAVQRLVRQKVSFAVRDEQETTVMAAVHDRDGEILPYLLKHARGLDRAFLNARGPDGNALSIAASRQSWESTALLIAAGVDPNVPSADGTTPLHAAAADGDSEVVSLLLRAGASVTAKDKDGRTPLDLARAQDDSEVVALLQKAGAR